MAASSSAAALDAWWDDVNSSPLWQDRTFHALAALYGVVAVVALVQLIRIECRVPEFGWTTQKARAMSTDGLRPAFCVINGVVYTIQIVLWLLTWWKPVQAVIILSKMFFAATSLFAAFGFLLYGGRLFLMLQRFPVESKGRRKKLNEVGYVTTICFGCFLVRCVMMCFSAFDKGADLDVLDHPIPNFFYYLLDITKSQVHGHRRSPLIKLPVSAAASSLLLIGSPQLPLHQAPPLIQSPPLMDYERIHEPLSRQSGGFSPAKLRAMLRGLEKHQRSGDDTSPEANDSGELDDRRSLECSTSMSSHSGHRSRHRAPDDDSFDSESSSSGPPTVKRSAAVAALLPPFSRPTPSKWDDAEKWISSPTSNHTGRAGPATGTVPKKSSLAFPEHGGRPPAVAKVVADVPISTGPLVKNSDGLTQSDLFKPAQSSPIVDEPEAAIRSVSMRDMGTEMTPIASQEPSRTGTPIIASSPTSSRTPTPQRTTEFSLSNIDSNKKEMSEEELQINTRQEIMDLGQRLGKTTIAAWASKEEKAAAHLTSSTTHKVVNIDMEARATDWQEAEKAKYLARFHREEAKIQAWENHQKAKIEAEMKRIEAKIERKRAREQDRLANKLAAVSHRAEAKREAAEVRRSQEAARTEEMAAEIRETGHAPSSFSCWCWCL